MAGVVNTIGQSKRGGGDRSSRPAQFQAREGPTQDHSLWVRHVGSDHSVPTSRSYYMIQRNFDMRKILKFSTPRTLT